MLPTRDESPRHYLTREVLGHALGLEEDRQEVDVLLAKLLAGDAWLLSPAFAEALGDPRRARAEQRRLDALDA